MGECKIGLVDIMANMAKVTPEQAKFKSPMAPMIEMFTNVDNSR